MGCSLLQKRLQIHDWYITTPKVASTQDGALRKIQPSYHANKKKEIKQEESKDTNKKVIVNVERWICLVRRAIARSRIIRMDKR